jgi:hypothetical protein
VRIPEARIDTRHAVDDRAGLHGRSRGVDALPERR